LTTISSFPFQRRSTIRPTQRRHGCRHAGYGGTRHPLMTGTDAMITATRLNGDQITVNADLLERIESTPDTVLTFVDGKKLVVRDAPDAVIDQVITFRARILAVAEEIYRQESPRGPAPLTLLSSMREEGPS
jgi:flagellar protein FlbD